MAEFYYGSAPPPQAEPMREVAAQPELPVCDQCGDFVVEGEECLLVSRARIVRSAKSGRLIPLEIPENVDQNIYLFHNEYCLGAYVAEVTGESYGDPPLCVVCESKLEG